MIRISETVEIDCDNGFAPCSAQSRDVPIEIRRRNPNLSQSEVFLGNRPPTVELGDTSLPPHCRDKLPDDQNVRSHLLRNFPPRGRVLGQGLPRDSRRSSYDSKHPTFTFRLGSPRGL